jgi:hypothetical protein
MNEAELMDDETTGGDRPEVLTAEETHSAGGEPYFKAQANSSWRFAARGSMRLTIGVVLLAIGGALLAQQYSHHISDGGAVFVVAAAFLAAWAVRGMYGFLLPGAILAGIAAGDIFAGADTFHNAEMICLGGGFVAIFVLDFVRRGRAHWWPLVPGIVLVVTGLVQSNAGWSHVRDLLWPALLIVVGLGVVIGALGERKGGRP